MTKKNALVFFFSCLLMAGMLFASSPVEVKELTGYSTLMPGQEGEWTVLMWTQGQPQYTGYINYIVNWGDGTQTPVTKSANGAETSFTHSYGNAGSYTLTFTGTDDYGTTGQGTYDVEVIDAASAPDLKADSLALDTYWKNGQVNATLVIKNVGAQTSGKYAINWIVNGATASFGSPSPGIDAGATATHTFMAGYFNPSTVTVQAKIVPLSADASAANNMAQGSVVVAPINITTQGANMTCKSPIITGEQGYCDINAADPGVSSISGTLDWGDGAADNLVPGVTRYYHAYQKYGYKKAEAIIEQAHGFIELSYSIDVKDKTPNLPPTITKVEGPSSIEAGTAGTWTIYASDPEGLKINYGIYWGENHNGENEGDNFAYGYMDETRENAGTSASFSHTYAKTGMYKIKVAASDTVVSQDMSSFYDFNVNVTGNSVNANEGSLNATGKPACTDSDGGKNIHVKGRTNGSEYPGGPVVTKADSCSESTVKEYYCDSMGLVASVLNSCPTGYNCGDGVCVAIGNATAPVENGTAAPPRPPASTPRVKLDFRAGWNQVSVPTGYIVSLSDIQQKCSVTSAWYYDTALGQYSAATAFGNGTAGAWMKAGSDCTYELDAPYASTWSVPLKAGWNMIGAPVSTAQFSDYAGDCKVTSGPWNYSPSQGQYAQSSMLEPGKGYWVKVASACTLGTNTPPGTPSG